MPAAKKYLSAPWNKIFLDYYSSAFGDEFFSIKGISREYAVPEHTIRRICKQMLRQLLRNHGDKISELLDEQNDASEKTT